MAKRRQTTIKQQDAIIKKTLKKIGNGSFEAGAEEIGISSSSAYDWASKGFREKDSELRELAARGVDVVELLTGKPYDPSPAANFTRARLEALDSLQMLQKRLLEQMTTADREGSIEGYQELTELFRGVAEYVKQADPDCDADSPGKSADTPDAPQRGRAG